MTDRHPRLLLEDLRIATDRLEEAQRALWECLLLSGADSSAYAYETQTEDGREAGLRRFICVGTPGEVVEAVRELRAECDG